MSASLLSRPDALLAGPSYVTGIDPRARILGAVAFAAVVAFLQDFAALGLALGVAGGAVAAARLRLVAVLMRLGPPNLFFLFLALVLPLSAPGEPLGRFGPLGFSREGLLLAAAIALKGNAVLLVLLLLVGTLELGTLGHALDHLYVPDKLAHLLLFTVRYLEVMERQYRQLAAAMKVRGFRPGPNRHTLRACGHLVGMLLVRSLDRSDRVLAAMKCRGFAGHFWMLDHFALRRRDAVFGLACAAVLALLIGVQWR